MFNPALLNTEVQDFILNFNSDVTKLAFAGSPFENVTVKELIQQIEGRKKAEKKLPKWFNTSGIVYPPKLNLEQTSSETTAKYKASIVDGQSIADLTGGFGIDSYYFSEKFENVNHFEINDELSEIAKHNFEVFSKKNIFCSAKDGLSEILHQNYDVVYADPSRRHDSKGKVFFLKDCQPDITTNISEILKKCKTFLLKTSPMLDISVGLSELEHVSEIHIVAVSNEVKELLWLLKKDFSGDLEIKTINFKKSITENFNFTWKEFATSEYSLPLKYLYEPNSAILKSGAFDLITAKFGLKKLHINTHLYTSDTLIEFPGRRFIVEKIVPYKKSEMKAALTFKKANITTRNFPEPVETLRKKWKMRDGGDKYLFFVTSEKEKSMLICTKI